MAVRIRMKRVGRTHRPYFRICAMDKRTPRDGRVLEELGTYDPSVSDTHARAVLKAGRIDYWLSVGAQPSEKVAVLIKKYGTDGTHLQEQQAALEKLAAPKVVPDAGPAVFRLQEQTPSETEAEAADASAADADAKQTDAANEAATSSSDQSQPPQESPQEESKQAEAEAT